MKIININGIDYKFEFTIEASLYNECTEKVVGLMTSIAEGTENGKGLKDIITTISDIPKTALTIFYAGLLEHHGPECFSANPVNTIRDAKQLLKIYFAEHVKDGTGNFYDVLQIMIEAMAEDGFFKQIGLEQMMNEPAEKKEPKKPQDHKKKATKASEK